MEKTKCKFQLGDWVEWTHRYGDEPEHVEEFCGMFVKRQWPAGKDGKDWICSVRISKTHFEQAFESELTYVE